jgi:enoyl-CoA hydratase/carnithine racemase
MIPVTMTTEWGHPADPRGEAERRYPRGLSIALDPFLGAYALAMRYATANRELSADQAELLGVVQTMVDEARRRGINPTLPVVVDLLDEAAQGEEVASSEQAPVPQAGEPPAAPRKAPRGRSRR